MSKILRIERCCDCNHYRMSKCSKIGKWVKIVDRSYFPDFCPLPDATPNKTIQQTEVGKAFLAYCASQRSDDFKKQA